MCTGVRVCMFASLCVSAKWYLPTCREGRSDLNVFVSLWEQYNSLDRLNKILLYVSIYYLCIHQKYLEVGCAV